MITITFSNARMSYNPEAQDAFEAGKAAYTPNMSPVNAMPYAIYMDDDRRQAFFVGWRIAQDGVKG
jgi:hypothetical protein